MVRRIEVRVPVRVDLAGCWTNFQPYASDFGGEVVNFAIDRYIKCFMEVDEGGEKRIEYSSDVPTGSGLGTSGAMNVELIATITEDEKSPEDITKLSYKFEELLKNSEERQNQWDSVKGGFNHLLFLGDEVEEMPFGPMKSSKNWLRKYFIIAYSGNIHKSRDIHKKVWMDYKNQNKNVLEGLHCIRVAARLMANGLQQDRREMVVKSLKDVVKGVDLINSEIHDPFREVIEPLIENKHAVAWKALGAGCGGSVGILCSPSGRKTVIESIEEAGWENIEWDYDEQGIKIEER